MGTALPRHLYEAGRLATSPAQLISVRARPLGLAGGAFVSEEEIFRRHEMMILNMRSRVAAQNEYQIITHCGRD